MVCIYCGHPTHVVNSRLQRRQNTIWRRRVCDTCKSIFTTQEQPLHAKSILVRHTDEKKLQPFSRDTLFVSIYETCKHRPKAILESSALTETIMSKAFLALESSVIERETLVAITHDVLDRFDPTAANLYAAYHPLRAERVTR